MEASACSHAASINVINAVLRVGNGHGQPRLPMGWRCKMPAIEMRGIIARANAGSSRSDVLKVHSTCTTAHDHEGKLLIHDPKAPQLQRPAREEMEEWIQEIKQSFRTLEAAERVCMSAYDTAWVARVPAMEDGSRPQFPLTLDWIMANQHSDGSWGYPHYFLAYDRLLATLACVIALKTWSQGHTHVERGLQFIRNTLPKLYNEPPEHRTSGFEIVFPSMLDDAKDLNLDLPYNSEPARLIQAQRQTKLKRLPLDILYGHPSTLLFSLEGLYRMNLDWEKLKKLQDNNGSFVTSLASTACALMCTKDLKCLEYISSVLEMYQNAVPTSYPIDLFDRLWLVDRVERLGIARYFQEEIKDALQYIYENWTERGIGWASNCNLTDLDDTNMAFRLLRLHGYSLSTDVFHNFKRHEKFFTFDGETDTSVTATFNLYRASQFGFPHEVILKEAHKFSQEFLIEQMKNDVVRDKWVIANHLHGEVKYALKLPWFASLPRIETREYLDLYGVDDVWIAKALYTLPNSHNGFLLNLAQADYQLCQHIHQKEHRIILRWSEDVHFVELKCLKHKETQCFFLISSTMFEPNMDQLRLAWTKCHVLVLLLQEFFRSSTSLEELNEFYQAFMCWELASISHFSQDGKILFMGLYDVVDSIIIESSKFHGWDTRFYLHQVWVKFIGSLVKEAEWRHFQKSPTSKESMDVALVSIGIEPIVLCSTFFLGTNISKDDIFDQSYDRILRLASLIVHLTTDMNNFTELESSYKPFSSISPFMKDNTKSTKEDAIMHCKVEIDQAISTFLQEILTTKMEPPLTYRHLFLNIARIHKFRSLVPQEDMVHYFRKSCFDFHYMI